MKNIDLRNSVHALAEGLYTIHDVAEYIHGLSHIYAHADPEGTEKDVPKLEYVFNMRCGNRLLLLYTSPEYSMLPYRLIELTKRKLEEFLLSDEFHYCVQFDYIDGQNTGFTTDKKSIIYLLRNGANK